MFRAGAEQASLSPGLSSSAARCLPLAGAYRSMENSGTSRRCARMLLPELPAGGGGGAAPAGLQRDACTDLRSVKAAPVSMRCKHLVQQEVMVRAFAVARQVVVANRLANRPPARPPASSVHPAARPRLPADAAPAHARDYNRQNARMDALHTYAWLSICSQTRCGGWPRATPGCQNQGRCCATAAASAAAAPGATTTACKSEREKAKA